MKSLLAALFILAPAAAVAAPAGYFDLAPGVTLETGDTWTDPSGQRFRLYAVQSCIRGSQYTDENGVAKDCGDVSLAMFGAYIKDTKPICAPVAKQPELTYVICYATVGNQRLDLGNILITTGYAFASLNQEGLPVYPAYAVSEQEARKTKSGLWQYSNVPHPAIILSQAAAKRAAEAADAAKKAPQ